MFIINLKFSEIKKVLAVVLSAIILIFGLSLITKNDAPAIESISTSSKIKTYSAANNEERRTFIASFGWECSDEPIEISEVIIPTEFDETYKAYNEIQKAQKLDLTAYKGKRVKRYSYSVSNYPSHPSNIRVNLLVYKGIIIGGDVSSIELGGFMHGFEKA